MPLPLIPVLLGGAALATAAFGAKKGYDAYSDTQETEEYHNKAQRLYNSTANKVNKYRSDAQNSFETLGELQTMIMQESLKRYEDIIDRLDVKDNISFKDILSVETLKNIDSVRESIVTIQNTLGGFVGGAAAGAMAGFGAFGGAGLLASASTGTAISSLSGVAATNATLAWFGGGSLAAGGLGMAGGTFVLSSIVAAPVIAVAAFVFAASAEKKKYNAQAYYDSVEALCESMEAEGLIWKEIKNKAKEKVNTLRDLNNAFIPLLDFVENAMQTYGHEISKWDEQSRFKLKTMMQNAETIVNIINAPIMNDDDSLTRDLLNHQQKCKSFMDEIQEKWGS